MASKIEKTEVAYKGRVVTAKKLTVNSRLPINVELAWAKVQTPELLEFITKGKLKFKPLNSGFSFFCEEGKTLGTRMLAYGFIPFGGIHTLYFDKVDSDNHILQTKEQDSIAKVWNHKISMTKIDKDHIEYEDEIVIYASGLTAIVTCWAKSFYEYRQRRWLKIVDNQRIDLTV
jgi:hypothetical protein